MISKGKADRLNKLGCLSLIRELKVNCLSEDIIYENI